MTSRKITPKDVAIVFLGPTVINNRPLSMTGESTIGDPSEGMDNPMTAPGSLIRGGAAGGPVELLAGSEGEVLKMASGLPSWEIDAGGMENPMTSEGQMIRADVGGTPIALDIGTVGYKLTVQDQSGSIVPDWAPDLFGTAESIQDMLSSFIVGGANITVTYNDVIGTLTISAATIPTHYRHMLFVNDGAGGWGIVEITIDGQTMPVMGLFESE